MPSPVPTLGRAIDYLLALRNHPSQVPLTLTVQSLVPIIRSVGDDPVVLLLQNPAEVGPVVMPIHRRIADQAIKQDWSLAILEDEGRVVEV